MVIKRTHIGRFTKDWPEKFVKKGNYKIYECYHSNTAKGKKPVFYIEIEGSIRMITDCAIFNELIKNAEEDSV